MIHTTTLNGVRLRYVVLNPQIDDIQAVYKKGATVKGLSEDFDIGCNFNYANTKTGTPIGRLIVEGQEVVQDIPKTEPRDELYMLPDRTLHIGKAPDNAVWAVQGSPRLLKDGVSALAESVKRDQTGTDIWQRDARRTACGIDKEGSLVLVSTLNETSLDNLRFIMQHHLGCVDALNGDGGGSSYLYPADTGWGRKLGSAIVANVKGDWNMNPVYDVWQNVRITSEYGWRDGVMHYGIDLATYRGDKVPAFWGGKVVYAGETQAGTGLGDYGIAVIVQDERDMYHVYAHLDAVKCAVGDVVKRGSVIGLMGNTGDSHGAHTHYEVRVKGASWGWRNTMNPTKYLELLFDLDKRTNKKLAYGSYDVNDGEPNPTYLIDGHMYAPVRDVAESMGAKVVSYDNEKKHAKIKMGE